MLLRRPTTAPRHPTDIVYCEPQLGGDDGLVVLRRVASPYWYAVIYAPRWMTPAQFGALPHCTADLCTIDKTLVCPSTQRRVVVYWMNGVCDQKQESVFTPLEQLYVRVRDFIRRYLPSSPSSSPSLSAPSSPPPP